MSADEIIQVGKPLPRLASVRCVDGNQRLIGIRWATGPRAGRTEIVDLSPLIDSHKFYAPLREGATTFATVHLVNDGAAIAWGDDDEIDMSASSVQRLAEETMTADDLRDFLVRNKLTQEAAAACLGRSKRALAGYLEQGLVPRIVALACLGLEVRWRSQLFRGAPWDLPPLRETLHAEWSYTTIGAWHVRPIIQRANSQEETAKHLP
jgi:hypothetical protein